MRLIGHLAEQSAAQTFADFLYVHGIQNEIEHEKGSGYGIWISEEDQIARATDFLKDFQANPTEPKYREGSKKAADKRGEAEKDQEAYRRRLRNRRHLFRSVSTYGFGPLTFALIVASAAVFAFPKWGDDPEPIHSLFISEFIAAPGSDQMLVEIRHGEIWRLITPMLIHWTWLHIIFNMLWLRDLGSMIEARQSSLQLFLLVVVIAALSNLGQFFVSGPIFGGMSGVVYGLLGYIWIRGKFDPASGLYLHPSTVTMMLVWFVLCVASNFSPLPFLRNIANTAHGVGLGVGMAWGYLSSLRPR